MDSSLIIELAINGALIGLMYALVALGIVLIYKTSGLANLAQGAIATYRALGGGWETRVGHEFVPQETIDQMRARTNWGDILSPDYGEGADMFLFQRPNAGTPEQEKETQHDHPN